MNRLLNGLVIVVVAGCIAITAWPTGKHGVSPARVAGEYVKTLAHNSGVRILGDKVWSVRKLKDGVTLVAVRVRFTAPDIFGYQHLGVTTIFVRLLKSDYVVAG